MIYNMELRHQVLAFFLSFLMIPVFQGQAFARHKKKFKGVIIVNQILRLDGTLTVNGNPAPEFSGVKEGDILETGEKSYAVVRIVGLGIFRLSPLSRMKLKSFHNRDESRFELFGGEVFSVFKRPGTHEMKLPHSVVSLHQSIFIARTGGGDGDEIQLFDGKIEVKDLIDSSIGEPTTSGPAIASAPPNGISLDAKVPAPNTISKAEIKAPSKNIVDVVPHPVLAPAPTSAIESVKQDLPREATVSPDGHPKLIRLTPAGVAIVDGQFNDDGVKKNVSDLESLYALP